MATRTFDQILSDVTAQSDPQRQAVLSQIADLPNQQAADQASLDATKNQSYNDITSEARQRGLGFSGIPLGEQATYDSGTYLPAVAKLKSNYVTTGGNLATALAGIGSQDYTTANDIFNGDRTFDEQQREFNANLQAQQDAASAQNASNAALGSLFSSQQSAPDPYASVDKQGATNAIVSLLKTNNPGTVNATIKAITDSANRGNLYDQFKLELLNQYQTASPYSGLLTQASAYKAPTTGNISINSQPSTARISF